MSQELSERGMSPEQVSALTINLSMIKMNVSSYVNTVAIFSIIANGSFLYGVVRKFDREEFSR